jgi:hypothetical protein
MTTKSKTLAELRKRFDYRSTEYLIALHWYMRGRMEGAQDLRASGGHRRLVLPQDAIAAKDPT